MTLRLPQQRTPTVRQPNGATILALMFMLLISGGLLAFVTLILPNAWWLILMLGGFGGVVSLHYFTWGRWLMRVSQQSEIDDENHNT